MVWGALIWESTFCVLSFSVSVAIQFVHIMFKEFKLRKRLKRRKNKSHIWKIIDKTNRTIQNETKTKYGNQQKCCLLASRFRSVYECFMISVYFCFPILKQWYNVAHGIKKNVFSLVWKRARAHTRNTHTHNHKKHNDRVVDVVNKIVILWT